MANALVFELAAAAAHPGDVALPLENPLVLEVSLLLLPAGTNPALPVILQLLMKLATGPLAVGAQAAAVELTMLVFGKCARVEILPPGEPKTCPALFPAHRCSSMVVRQRVRLQGPSQDS